MTGRVNVVAGSLAATTFYLRFGSNSGQNTWVNGIYVSAVRRYGGALKTFIEVTEIAA
jgi:hypothetical protein